MYKYVGVFDICKVGILLNHNKYQICPFVPASIDKCIVMARMLRFKTSLSFIIGIALFHKFHCASFADVSNLRALLLSNYDRYVRPSQDQDVPLQVKVEVYLRSVLGIDESKGVLTSSFSVGIEWNDFNLKWNTSEHGNVSRIKMDEHEVWTPYFIPANAIKWREKFGLETNLVTVYNDGIVFLLVGGTVQSKCDVDVQYFPFDIQTCVIELSPYGNYHYDIEIISEGVNQVIYQPSNQWILLSATSKSSFYYVSPYTEVTLTLKRRYTFFLMNMFAPILMMLFLNTLVFFLPAESGERIGYATVCLLSLAVYMSLLSENMPQSSQPVPVVIYLLFLYMFDSALICIETIVGLRFFHWTNNPVNNSLIRMVLCTGDRVSPQNDQPCGEADMEIKSLEVTNEDGKWQETPSDSKTATLTWKKFSFVFDRYCFVLNIVFILMVTIVYFAIVTSA